MGRLPYDKQYGLADRIYEGSCARHPDWSAALSDTKAVFEKRAAAALATRPTSSDKDR